MLRLAVTRLAFLGALFASPSLQAHDYTLGDLKIGHPWARVSAVQNGAAYMTIATTGTTGDRLVSAASPAADRVELHTHIMDGNVMRMRQVPAIEVKPGETATLKPGGLHVMLLGLKKPLTEGLAFPLTLTFEKAGTIDVEVKVQKDEASGGHGAPASSPSQPGTMHRGH
ncbi:MAG: copper chaperone PCu(A)C [Alphaproteobacteria bacterium]